MQFWEFLLQHKDDNTWFPVKIPTLTLEEGQYKIYAISSLVSTDIEVKINYANGHQSVSQKYHRRSNQQGQVMILPLTYLQPGTWELLCRGDIISELFGEPWQVTLVLQITPKPDYLFTQPTQDLEISKSSPPINNGNSTNTVVFPTVDATLPNHFSNKTIFLAINQDTYTISPDHCIEISGTINAPQTSQFERQSFRGKLYYQLRSPETGELLLNIEQDLAPQTLPLAFSYTLEIPDKWRTCLILGEVILEFFLHNLDGSTSNFNLSQTFRIVASPKKIVETLEYMEALSTWNRTNPHRKPKKIQLPDTTTSKDSFPELRPSTGRILPPKISSGQRKIQPLCLPPVSKSSNSSDLAITNNSPVDHAFESLKLGDRFWSRLSELAQENE